MLLGIEINHQSINIHFGSHWRCRPSTGEFGRLSQLWLLVYTII